MTKIEAVVFDIGNVLIGWQPEPFYDKHIGEDRRREMFATVDLHGANDRLDRGEGFRDIFYDLAEEYPKFKDEIRLWHDRWIDLTGPVIDHSVALLRALKTKGIPVFALTNFGVETFAMSEGVYPFLREFDRRYISGHMKRIKPEPEIYQMLEADCGIAPDALLFTDDRLDNINAAKARGWQTHQFVTATDWADTLIAHGLLSFEEAKP
ncbi:HAD family hydrolase [Cochlodiniinecator piscidefendens]|uniref:HAD family hydrolase n=1 Tax=Cochlodiniinecator piscidefendens TaxID=2715756 RepID=UPI001409A6CC|nr:HAD family phosphatase [Cochlodiniinecator piscidefendens]